MVYHLHEEWKKNIIIYKNSVYIIQTRPTHKHVDPIVHLYPVNMYVMCYSRRLLFNNILGQLYHVCATAVVQLYTRGDH